METNQIITLVDVMDLDQQQRPTFNKGFVNKCFKQSGHADLAWHNAEAVMTNGLRDNIFAVHHRNIGLLGITGLWYEDNPIIADLAWLRWTGIDAQWRGLGFSHVIIDLLAEKALAQGRKMLVEIAHTEFAAGVFTHLGFTRVPDNEMVIGTVLKLLGEEHGSVVLTKPVVEGYEYDWKKLYMPEDDGVTRIDFTPMAKYWDRLYGGK